MALLSHIDHADLNIGKHIIYSCQVLVNRIRNVLYSFLFSISFSSFFISPTSG